MSPSRRRRAVCMLVDRLGISERRACRIVGQLRSTQRREPIVAQDDAALMQDYLQAGYTVVTADYEGENLDWAAGHQAVAAGMDELFAGDRVPFYNAFRVETVRV